MSTILLLGAAVLIVANTVSQWTDGMTGFDSQSAVPTWPISGWFLLIAILLVVCAVFSLQKEKEPRWRRLLYVPLGMLILYYGAVLVWSFVQWSVWYLPVVSGLLLAVVAFVISRNKAALDRWYYLH